jgi:hypothetical protein
MDFLNNVKELLSVMKGEEFCVYLIDIDFSRQLMETWSLHSLHLRIGRSPKLASFCGVYIDPQPSTDAQSYV